MNFLKFKNATEFLAETDLSVEEGLRIVERELDKLKQEANKN